MGPIRVRVLILLIIELHTCSSSVPRAGQERCGMTCCQNSEHSEINRISTPQPSTSPMWEPHLPVGTFNMQPSLLLVVTAALWTAVSAQISGRSETSAVNETELLGQLPPCGVCKLIACRNFKQLIWLTNWWQLQCLVEEIPKSNCTATDLPCICTNQQLNDMVTLCVAQSCTIRESLSMIDCPFPRPCPCPLPLFKSASEPILTTGSNQECDFDYVRRPY